jgi:hypothetical protein
MDELSSPSATAFDLITDVLAGGDELVDPVETGV